MTISKTNNELIQLAKKILKIYIQYQNICYSKKSNKTFDLEYDAIQCQTECFYLEYENLLYEIENDCVESGWKKHLNQDLKCANEIEEYFNALTKSPRPKYIYG